MIQKPLTIGMISLVVGLTVGAFAPPVQILQTLGGMEGRVVGEVRDFGGIKMLWCPPGSFVMGSPLMERRRERGETEREVFLDRGFWLARTECTQAHWERIMGGNPSEHKGPLRPVERISLEDCHQWLEKMNAQFPLAAGWRWTLPSEAQWEYACRAGTRTPFSCGNWLGPKDAVYSAKPLWGGVTGKFRHDHPMDVGSFPPNDWGFFDMHGNVWEECASRWNDYWATPDSEHFMQSRQRTSVMRGGSYFSSWEECRSASRRPGGLGRMSKDRGFRAAISWSPEDIRED